LVAFVENWLPCPSIEKIRGYTKVIVSFAVSYTWQPSKNLCDTSCTIGSPVPICGNSEQPGLVKQWKEAGTTVLLSFGGAGMGGSWAGDVNDCWEHCFDRVDSVVSQLTEIVSRQDFDGVDIDYEYFLTTKSATFLADLTTKLKEALGSDKIVSHAPMDRDVDSGKM
jgi:GH18 family chitinase